MNCVQRIAPADEGPMLQPWPDSTSVIPARIDQRRPKALAARFQIGVRTAVPLHGVGELSPLRTLGLRPRLWLLRSAREAIEATAGTLAVRRFSRQIVAAGLPRLAGL